MTACWCGLTQPEKRRRKKPRGGGGESMAKACPRGRPGSRGPSLVIVSPQIGTRLPRQQSLRKRSTRLFVDTPSSAEFSHLTGWVDRVGRRRSHGRAPRRTLCV